MRTDAWAAVHRDPRARAAASAPLLDESHERALLDQAQRGDRAAIDTLVRCHMRMIVRIAACHYQPGLAAQDIVSEGVLGLLIAISRFDRAQSTRLSTYASWWIRAHVRRYVQANRHVVAPPSTRGVRLARNRAGYVRRDLMQALQRPPTNAEVANALGVAESDVALIEQARTQRDLSLSVDDREGTIDLHDREGRSPEELVSGCEERVETARLVQRAVSQLRPRDRSIIQQHLLAEEPREMAEIARSLGTSRQRVSQILMRVRRQLASELRNVAS